MNNIPSEIEPDLRRAIHLEWWTLAWQSSIVVILFFVLGSSAAMKSAWIEDILGLLPPIVFLIALHFEKKKSTKRFPFGFKRVNSLAFLVSATALLILSLYLLIDSGMKLVMTEHPMIGPVTFFGREIWLGWLMMAALAYSVVPPVILGRKKLPVAYRLSDKVLHTDALMLKADWMTSVAAIAGIAGVGFGLWWADAVAAAVIALDILRDGVRALTIATAELIDGAPRKLENNEIDDEASQLRDFLAQRFPGGEIRLRESGRYILADVRGVEPPKGELNPADYWPGSPERAWRFGNLSVSP